MSSLLFLTSEDFTIQQTQNMNVLVNNISGISLILYYSTQCVYCQKCIPMFKKLPDMVNGCNFGMVNVSMNRQLLQMANSSTTPITYVPYIILYVNGHPYIRYDGPSDINNIVQFVVQVSNQVHQEGLDKVAKHKIPEYTVGHPIVGKDEVCYLSFDEKSGYFKCI